MRPQTSRSIGLAATEHGVRTVAKIIRAALHRSRQSTCGQRPTKAWPEWREFRCGLPRGHDGVCEYYRIDKED